MMLVLWLCSACRERLEQESTLDDENNDDDDDDDDDDYEDDDDDDDVVLRLGLAKGAAGTGQHTQR